ncbi:hypothetical protein GGX14DRAFT_388763 [Mycena pura]|uniref:Uncharacterized protein n=1 Tax=Mycena pura TaxID=153505 RepID=A0AAD6VXD3_9AGAR|nr:hypothetical protein GGX14DRAFT_388763 [Mycena pura]
MFLTRVVNKCGNERVGDEMRRESATHRPGRSRCVASWASVQWERWEAVRAGQQAGSAYSCVGTWRTDLVCIHVGIRVWDDLASTAIRVTREMSIELLRGLHAQHDLAELHLHGAAAADVACVSTVRSSVSIMRHSASDCTRAREDVSSWARERENMGGKNKRSASSAPLMGVFQAPGSRAHSQISRDLKQLEADIQMR